LQTNQISEHVTKIMQKNNYRESCVMTKRKKARITKPYLESMLTTSTKNEQKQLKIIDVGNNKSSISNA
jgi:hypothetical protein